MKWSYGATAAVLMLLASSTPAWCNSFSAIAYSPSTGKYGYTVAKCSLDEAENVAVQNCGACDATVVLYGESGGPGRVTYAAVTVNNGRIGTGLSTLSLASAEAVALRGSCGGVVLCWAATSG